MDKQSNMAIIVNDLDSLVHRIEALEAHPELTNALVAVQNAKDAMNKARGDIHRRDMKARFAAADAGRPVPPHGSGP